MMGILLLIAVLTVLIVWKIRASTHQQFIKSISSFMEELDKRPGERFEPKQAPPDRYVDLVRSVNSMSESIHNRLAYMGILQDRLKLILDHMTNAVILLDRKAMISYVNPAAELLFGQSRIQLIGKSHWRIGRESGLSEAIDLVLKGEQVDQIEITLPYTGPLQRKQSVMEVTLVPDRDEQSIHGAIVILHDITERKDMERMRKEFVANVSHELRTPLTAIRGYTETLLSGAKNDPDTAEQFLHIIQDESIRLQKMVNDLLDLSKLEHHKTTLHKENVNMQLLIDSVMDTVKLQAESKQIDLVVEKCERSMIMIGDPDLLRQLLLNLITNAIKYTNPHGSVRIQTFQRNGQVGITVKDTGVGITQEHLPRIFERFYRVEASRNMASGGRGLGLSIVKHIVQLHGGQIFVESEPGQGTLFTILFPSSNN